MFRGTGLAELTLMRRAWMVLVIALGGCAFEGSSLDFTIDPDATTRCERSATHVRCDHVTVTIATGALGLSAREVHLMHPVGEAPAGGWPAVILFQGSFHSAEGFFEGDTSGDFGELNQAALVADLLDAGFVVIAPEARYDGATYWDTNVLPWAFTWEQSEDHQLMVELFRALDDGTLGPIDGARLYAAGISSGGYMTSRMAVSYPGRFRALAIESASYATCSGFVCDVPELPADHPPTLLLHGREDRVVPLATAEAYAERLEAQDTPTRLVADDAAGHQWIDAAPPEIVAWFQPR